MDYLFAVFVLANGLLILGMYSYINVLRDDLRRAADVMMDTAVDMVPDTLTYEHQIVEHRQDIVQLATKLQRRAVILRRTPLERLQKWYYGRFA